MHTIVFGGCEFVCHGGASFDKPNQKADNRNNATRVFDSGAIKTFIGQHTRTHI